MKSEKIEVLRSCLLMALAGLVSTGTVQAAVSWNFNTGLTSGSTVSTCGPNTGCPYSLSLGALSTQNTTETNTAASAAGSTTFIQAKAYDWGINGLGVVSNYTTAYENPNSIGPHAFDNRFGTDAMILGFHAAVNLNAITIGWNGTDNGANGYTDSDLSVFAWVGSGTPTGTPMGTTVGPTTLTNSGWQLVGNYGDVGSLYGDRQAIDATVTGNTSKALYSSYWLVSAYNANYGYSSQSAPTTTEVCIAWTTTTNKCKTMQKTVATANLGTNGGELSTSQSLQTKTCSAFYTTSGNCKTWSTYSAATSNLLAFNDEFKLLMLAADPCRGVVSGNQCNAVPEPSGLALVGLGLLGLLTTRRRLVRRSDLTAPVLA